jgi:Lactonase, 7-bladed beta-propeller
MIRRIPRATALEIVGLFVLAMHLAGCGGGGGGGGGPPPMPHTIGGTITGLSGAGLVLADNSSDTLKPSGNGMFTFAQSVLDGNSFDVTVSSQPANPTQSCSVAHGMGTVSGSDITNVAVTCTTNSYTIGGTVSGLTGTGLVLADNGGNNLPVSKSGAFTFSSAIQSGVMYAVTVATQPSSPPQTCLVSHPGGTVGGSNITTVSVACTTNTYSVGGHVAGLTGSGLALSYNGGAPLEISRNGGFTSATGLAIGTGYSVTIAAQPTNPAQSCVLSNGSGSVDIQNVDSILVYCPQPVARLAYLVTEGDAESNPPVLGSISVYTINSASGALSLVPGSTVTTGPNVTSFQLVPHTSFAWALNFGDSIASSPIGGVSGIYDYMVDPNTGLLTLVAGSPFDTLNGLGNEPGCHLGGYGDTKSVTIYPNGLFGYASDTNTMGAENPDLWTFTIDATTGAPILGSTVAALCYGPGSLAIDPSAQFAYVAAAEGYSALGLFAFAINSSTGALTSVPGSPWAFSGGGSPPRVTIDSADRFAYAINGQILGFVIDSSSGALTPIAGSPNPIVSGGVMTIEPRGNFAYVTETNGIYIFSIDAASGALSPAAAGISPVMLQYPTPLQIDPSGEFAYTAATVAPGQVGVYAYTINAATGALTLVTGSPLAVNAYPGGYPVVGITIAN